MRFDITDAACCGLVMDFGGHLVCRRCPQGRLPETFSRASKSPLCALSGPSGDAVRTRSHPFSVIQQRHLETLTLRPARVDAGRLPELAGGVIRTYGIPRSHVFATSWRRCGEV